MNEHDDWEKLVGIIIALEWPETVPDHFLAYSFSVDREAHSILFRGHFSAPTSDEDEDMLYDIDTQLQAQMPDEWAVSTEFETVPPDGEPSLLPGGTLYHRGRVKPPVWNGPGTDPVRGG